MNPGKAIRLKRLIESQYGSCTQAATLSPRVQGPAGNVPCLF
jgi:hypothetical protein